MGLILKVMIRIFYRGDIINIYCYVKVWFGDWGMVVKLKINFFIMEVIKVKIYCFLGSLGIIL